MPVVVSCCSMAPNGSGAAWLVEVPRRSMVSSSLTSQEVGVDVSLVTGGGSTFVLADGRSKSRQHLIAQHRVPARVAPKLVSA